MFLGFGEIKENFKIQARWEKERERDTRFTAFVTLYNGEQMAAINGLYLANGYIFVLQSKPKYIADSNSAAKLKIS